MKVAFISWQDTSDTLYVASPSEVISSIMDTKAILLQAHEPSNARRSVSPPRADSLASMLRSLTTDDDYFERRSLRAACTQSTPLDDFHPQASEIVPGLFVCDMYTATSPAIVSGLGITHVASVLKDCPPFPKGMKHICVPIEDTHDAELLGHLDFAVDWITHALKHNGTVMIHCIWGMSRSASVAIAFLMVQERMSLQHALKYVVSKRKIVRPNSNFIQQLRVFEHVLHVRHTQRTARGDI